tara:strand:- start:42 stop:779 length:738 start_codon:yes stop_codon:yes gene_type:complete
MSLTAKFQNNTQNIEIVDEVLSLLSEKMNVDKVEAWTTISDKSVDELRKSVKKTKKKRAKTAYTMFSKDNAVTNKLRASIGGQVSIGEMSKLKSELWKNLSEKDKEKYEQMAKDENEANPVLNDEPKKKPKKKTGYNMFLADKELRDSITKKSKSKMSMKEANEEMIKVWKTLTTDEKKKYTDIADVENSKMNDVVVKEEEKNVVVEEEEKNVVVEEEEKDVEVKDASKVIKKKSAPKKKSVTKK